MNHQISQNFPMQPQNIVCPFSDEPSNHQIWIHSQKERRYKCNTCNRTFSETIGTPLYGLKTPIWIVSLVLTLLAYGCPIQAIVMAFGFDERTVSQWHCRAGEHGKLVQEKIVCQGGLVMGQIQGDELWTKTQQGAVWIATALDVFSRLFIWGEVSLERKSHLIERVVQQVKLALKPSPADMLWVTDGFGAWASSITKLFRQPVYSRKQGRPRLVLPQTIHIAQVIKRRVEKRIVEIERRLIHGSWTQVYDLVQRTQIDSGKVNTAYVERLNATLRGWIPALTRRSRTPASRRRQMEAALFWTGVNYNFCRIHHSLGGTPAMAMGLSQQVWSVTDLLFCFRFKHISLHGVV